MGHKHLQGISPMGLLFIWLFSSGYYAELCNEEESACLLFKILPVLPAFELEAVELLFIVYR